MSVEITTVGPIPLGGGRFVWRATVIGTDGEVIDTVDGQSQAEINEYVEQVNRIYTGKASPGPTDYCDGR